MVFFNKKKREEPDPFENIFREFSRMQKEMDEMMRRSFAGEDMEGSFKKMQRGKPMVYGFSLSMGPDGKPKMEEFGNVAPEKGEVRDEREPLVDVMNKQGEITVLAELPGVEKDEIKLKLADEERALVISVPNKFYKKAKLPVRVKKDLAKACYKNGVLEINLTKAKENKAKPSSEIKIE